MRRGFVFMRRLSRLTGLPVLDPGSDRRVARVERPCLSADGQFLDGLAVRLTGFGGRKRYLPFANIRLLGEVSLQVSALLPLPAERREEETSPRVYGTAGELLGWATDALLDESDGRIRALELSFGYIDDLRRGRLWLRDFVRGPEGFVASLPDGSDPHTRT